MSCIRDKVNESRQGIREMRQRQLQFRLGRAPDLLWKTPVLTPVQKVKKAIKNSARTQAQILAETKLTKDEVSDAIADLLLCSNEIRTVVVDGTRMYFLNEPKVIQVSRKHDVLSPFSAIRELMPGKKVETKFGGWVAA